MIIRSDLLRWHLRVLNASKASVPVVSPAQCSRGERLLRCRLRWLRTTPLGLWRAVHSSGLVGLRVDILRQRCAILVRHAIRRLAILQQLQAGLNMHVGRVEISCTLVCIQRICSLVVAGFVLVLVSDRCLILLRMQEANSPEFRGRTKPQRYWGSDG